MRSDSRCRGGEKISVSCDQKYLQGDQFYNGAQLLDSTANGFSPAPQSSQLNQLRAPRPGQSSAQLNFLNTVNRSYLLCIICEL